MSSRLFTTLGITALACIGFAQTSRVVSAQAVSSTTGGGGNYEKIGNYRTLPDIMGVRLGMPLAEALGALRRELPKARIDPEPFTFPGLPTPPQEAWRATPTPSGRYAVLTANAGGVCAPPKGETDTMEVVFTAPPNPQVVARVHRCYIALLNNLGSPANPTHKKVLLQSLREKYGKETVAFGNMAPGIRKDDATITELYWLFDEAGRPAPLPAGFSEKSPLDACFEEKFIPRDVEHYEEYAGQRLTPWCASSGVGLRVALSMMDDERVGHFRMDMIDVPLMLRELKQTRDWWRAEIDRLRQQEIEKSKQQKPRL